MNGTNNERDSTSFNSIRESIHEQLREQIPYLQRHECVARVMERTDLLLDQLLELNVAEETEASNE